MYRIDQREEKDQQLKDSFRVKSNYSENIKIFNFFMYWLNQSPLIQAWIAVCCNVYLTFIISALFRKEKFT